MARDPIERYQTAAELAGPDAKNGTFGRFRYIPSKDRFILVNSVKQNVFIYRLP